MIENKEKNNILTFRKRFHINIGLTIFGFIFVYLLVTIIMYLTASHVTAYEVREGTIVKDTSYTGVVARSEVVVNAETSGYVNYYAAEGSKTGYGDGIYTLSDSEIHAAAKQTDTDTSLTPEEQQSILSLSQQFNETFKSEYFYDVYNLKSDIDNILQNNSNQNKVTQLDAMLESAGGGITLSRAPRDGVVIYSVDGMESTSAEEVTNKTFKKKAYKPVELKDNMKVNSGDPVYKLITDETWSLVVQLDEDTAKELKDTKRIQVTFVKDNASIWGDLSVRRTKNGYLGTITFENSMIRYATERYLDIELVFEDETGLKVPKSALVKKAFYLVPESYITQGGNSKESGVLRQKVNESGEHTTEFVPAEVYYTQNGMVYLDPDLFDKNDILVRPESTETYKLEKMKNLNGVYNINKGYAVFKQITILCENQEYYIVEEGTNYGLSNYDHIALDGTSVDENDIVIQ